MNATPVPIVCPVCRGRSLEDTDRRILCTSCGRRFNRRNGVVDLRVGGRFEDETSEAVLESEERSSRDTTVNYWVPLFTSLWPRAASPPKILSVGCGIGMDVDTLSRHGFDVMGVDSGSRTRSWTRRTCSDRLVMANGLRLPFEDATFDAAFCGCVYPHVGVVGDSTRVSATHREQRLALATEMVRVLKPGGRLFASGANRRCPLDIFHGRDPGTYVPRVNAPWNRFLLSVRDYRRLFEQAGATGTRALPVRGYWGFVTSRQSWRGTLLSLPVRSVFWVVSRPAMGWLRGSIVDPWIVVTAEKKRA